MIVAGPLKLAGIEVVADRTVLTDLFEGRLIIEGGTVYIYTSGAWESLASGADSLPNITLSNAGQILKTVDGISASWEDQYPDDTGASGKFLQSDGVGGTSWQDPPAILPAQPGNSGKFLTTDGSAASWGTIPASALPSGIDAAKIGGGGVSTTEFDYLSGVTSDVQTQINGKISSTEKGAANGVATLDGTSKIPQAQLPAIAITDTFVVASQAAMLALTAETGDVAIRTDLNKSFILQGTDPTILGNWKELLTPTDTVLSVDGQTGAVSLSSIYQPLDADLTALAGLGSTGFAVRTASNTWAQRSVAAGTGISVTNGDGVSGNPSVGIDSTVVTLTGTQALTNKDIDGGTASNTSRMTVPKAATATLLGLARKQGTLLYDTSLLKLFVDNGSSLDAVGSGSGTGTGSLNIVTNPSATDNTNGWTAATNYTVSRDTSNSPLSGVVSTCFAISTTTASSESSTSGVYAASLAMPAALRNTRTQVSMYLTVPASSLGVWRVSVYNASGTRMSLSSDSSSVTTLPAGFTGQYSFTFDADSSASYTISFTQTTRSSANTLYATLISIGNGQVVQGYPGGRYETVSSFTIGATTTPPTPGTAAAYFRETIRDGSDAVIRFEYSQTGSGNNGAGSYTLPLPTGLTIDTSRIRQASTTFANSYLNSSGFLQADTAFYNVLASYNNSTSILVSLFNAITDAVDWGASTGGLGGTGNRKLSLTVRVPIAEWSGSGTVNLGAGAQVEYAYNTSTSTTVSDSSSFAYGPGGAQIQAITASLTRRVRFQYPVQAGDMLRLEVSSDQVQWFEVPTNGIDALHADGTTVYGMGFEVAGTINSTDVDVRFGQYRRDDTTFGGAGAAWSGRDTYYWRVVKAKASSPVGFGPAAAGTSGLISSEETNTFTATVTGCTATITGTARYTRVGKLVTLYVPAINGTSNSTTMTLTGAPTNITPQRNQVMNCLILDNGSTGLGRATIANTGTITFDRYAAVNNITSFTNTGGKGVPEQVFTYSLD